MSIDTALPPPAAALRRRHVIGSGWPEATPLEVGPPAPAWKHSPVILLDALQSPAMLRQLGIAVVPCLALSMSGLGGGQGRADATGAGRSAALALPGGRADSGSWASLAERADAAAASAGASAGASVADPAPDDGASQAFDDVTMLPHWLGHDLRTPIRNSARLVDAVLDSAGLDASSRATLEAARAAANRCADRLDGLVQLLRIGRSHLSPTLIDAAPLCTQLLGERAGGGAHPPAAVWVDDKLPLFGDLQLVTLALRHLLDNAVKFSQHADAPSIRVTGHAVPGFNVVAVSDNGAGFSALHAQALFQPFQRIHLQSEFAGDGIGLALVRRAAVRHGGWAWADLGTPGSTRFMLALPVQAVAVLAPLRPPASASDGGHHARA